MNRRSISTAVLFIAAGVLAACQPAAETMEQEQARMTAESDSARTAITAQMARFQGFVAAGQVDSLVSMYTPTAVLMPPGMPAITGTAALREGFTGMFAGMPPGATMTFTVSSVMANGPLAIERGIHTTTIPASGRTPAVTMTGKYLAHWHKVNGQWLMAEDIWNDDAPMPAQPPARR